MRVLCVTTHSDRPEAETFIGLHRLGIDLEVMCSPGALYYSHLKDCGVTVTDLEVKGKVDRAAVAAIRRRLREKPFDIIHGFNNATVANAVRAAAGFTVRVVAYRGIVGNVSFFNPASWMTYLHPRVDRVVCVAEAVRRHFLSMRFLGMRLPPEKFVTIYKGHSLDWYRQTPIERKDMGVSDNCFLVGCIANYRPRKGVEVLVDVAGLLPRDLPAQFLLVGRMDAPQLQRRIRSSVRREAFHLAGYRRDAPAWMAACDAYVLPALRREGLPKGVIEAMCYGVAPIVTDSGGSPELVEEGKSGLVVPSGSAAAIARAIGFLYDHPDARRQMGRAARERIRSHFHVETTITRTFDLYRSLVG
jgi:glycosyltransferase involved in cell wall biosynthesis